MQITLEYCKYYQIPIYTIDDYIELYKNKFKCLLDKNAVRYLIKKGTIDHVKHERKTYVIIEPKSMELLPLPRSTKFKMKESKDSYAVWRKSQFR